MCEDQSAVWHSYSNATFKLSVLKTWMSTPDTYGRAITDDLAPGTSLQSLLLLFRLLSQLDSINADPALELVHLALGDREFSFIQPTSATS